MTIYMMWDEIHEGRPDLKPSLRLDDESVMAVFNHWIGPYTEYVVRWRSKRAGVYRRDELVIKIGGNPYTEVYADRIIRKLKRYRGD